MKLSIEILLIIRFSNDKKIKKLSLQNGLKVPLVDELCIYMSGPAIIVALSDSEDMVSIANTP